MVKDMGRVTVGTGAEKESRMAPQEVVESPTLKTNDQILKDLHRPNKVHTFHLSDGRECILLERPGSNTLRAAMLIPPDKSDNQTLLNIIQSCLYVRSIGGIEFAPPQTFLEVQKLINDLGDEGLLDLRIELQSAYPVSDALQEKLKKIGEVRNL
jgi:hypothetical protein